MSGGCRFVVLPGVQLRPCGYIVLSLLIQYASRSQSLSLIVKGESPEKNFLDLFNGLDCEQVAWLAEVLVDS